MSVSPLVAAWSTESIPGGNTAGARVPKPSDPEFNNWLLTTLLFYRWSIHILGVCLNNLPPTETRLPNKAFEPLYELVRSMIGTVHKVAEQRGITVPPYTEVPADWKDEAAITTDQIRGELLPHVSGPIAKVIDFWTALDRSREQYHWSTFVAQIAVGVPIYMDAIMKAGKKAGMAEDETLVPFMDTLEDENLRKCIDAIGEEVMRIRADAAETGWREDEAKRTVIENRKAWVGFWGSD